MKMIIDFFLPQKPESFKAGFLPLLARVLFASSLFLFFWRSAMTKFDGLFSLSVGAYVQIFPKTFEALGYDPAGLSFLHHLIAFAGSYGEVILPLALVLGLMTRFSALGMLGFIFVLSLVDIVGHGVKPGQFFDGDPYGLIFDARLFWSFPLIVLLAHGGGWLSVDSFLARLSFVQKLKRNLST